MGKEKINQFNVLTKSANPEKREREKIMVFIKNKTKQKPPLLCQCK